MKIGEVTSFAKEFIDYVKSRKKLLLLPVFIVVILLGVLLVLSKGSVVAPFVYTLF